MQFNIAGLVVLFNGFTAKPSIDSKRALTTAPNGEVISASTHTITSLTRDYWVVTEYQWYTNAVTVVTVIMEDGTPIAYTGPGPYTSATTFKGTSAQTSAPKPSPITIVGTPLHINGPSATSVSALTEISCTGKATCTPSTSAVAYTCPVKDGTTHAITTTMQSYGCASGQKCSGSAVVTTFTCGCGKPVCTVDIPLLPIPVIFVPPGQPIPPFVPDEPGFPDEPIFTAPTLTSQGPDTVTTQDPGTHSGKTSSQPLTSSSRSSSSLSSSSSSLSSSSSSSKTSSSSASSSITSASACTLVSSLAMSDLERTLTAWLNQFPFTLPTATTPSSPSSAGACTLASSVAYSDLQNTISSWLSHFPFTLPAMTVSSSAAACTMPTSAAYSDIQHTISSWLSQFPFTLPPMTTTSSAGACMLPTSAAYSDIQHTISLWLSQLPFTLPTAVSSSRRTTTLTLAPTSTSINAASASKVSALSFSAFMASVSSSVQASVSRQSVSLSSLWLAASSVSASLASASSASSAASVASVASVKSAASAETESAKSTCVHYPSLVQSRPTMLPDKWVHLNDIGKERHRCLVDPAKVPPYDSLGKAGWKIDPWNCEWEFQPFSIAPGWDHNQPDKSLVDIFCQKLVDNVIITHDGLQTGICQVYDHGKCIAEENGKCSHWEYYIRAPCSSVVVFSVMYRTGSPLCSATQTNEPTNYKQMRFDVCTKKLMDNLITPCSMKKKDVVGKLKDFPVIGGTFLDGCMQYTMVARKNPPKVVWGADNRTD